MQSNIKEVWIKNFKSYKELKLPLNNFNVLIGPNASGKTNFIEFFKFFKEAVYGPMRPSIPYRHWWNYGNIVWQRDETLPITAGMKIEIKGHLLSYEVTFSGAGGEFKLLRESLSIEGVLSLEREGQNLKINHDPKFIEENRKKIEQFEPILGTHPLKLDDLVTQVRTLPLGSPSLLGFSAFTQGRDDIFLAFLFFPPTPFKKATQSVEEATQSVDIPPIVITPALKNDNKNEVSASLYYHVQDTFRKAIGGFTLLRHINMKAVRDPSPAKKETELSEDGSNVPNLLYNWYLEKGRLPERIEAALAALFPETQIKFSLTDDGRVLMNVVERGILLQPPSISDGFYKMLAVLTAIESKPAFLAIDEIETSLHAKVLEYVIDELKGSGITAVLSTHSPTVVDIVKPEDLIMAEKTFDEGTKLKRIKDPDKVREQLHKAGITQSESWLYGKLE